ncbi:RNA polymerase sigma-70 factor (ECF subfamily) [Tenacibaculum adriaticum]|uniref:RNA polymerase sigma-70 factor (ECF subfamily) n=1 Tax=Tenacibaculum adriaticum TaxID=413713 RepID=A0A5S5DZM4_9FLAO|nr:RNA polymerase sigma-70 factor [Tenacibaculum adriaticum]TYQ00193.1 RNA polymerase sigma-70 factor (ECF subfamily) [Tenacibaculum adriaticum]
MQNTGIYKLSLKEYENLFDKQYVSLCLFANNYISDLEVSKDLVQDVFIKIWEYKIKFQSENSIKSYLYTSVKNKSLDYLKNKRVKTTDYFSIAEMEKLETEPFFLSEVVISETSSIIEQAINTLPNKCAIIIRMSIKNFTNSQIAEELNISINTVKTQKKIAYKKLRPLLKDHFILIAFIFDNLN